MPMSERGSRKIPVTERQFLWVQDDDKGEVILHVGPTMVSPTATAEEVAEGAVPKGLDNVAPVELTRGQLIVIRGLDTQFYIPPTGVDVVPDLSVDEKGTQLTAEAARRILASMPIPAAEGMV